MNCFYHRETEAAAACNNCGRPLCRHCASLYKMPLCAECAKAEVEALQEDIKKLTVTGIVIGVASLIGLLISGVGNGNGHMLLLAIPTAYIAGSIPFGWRTLTSITPKMFVFLPLLGWVIYFVIKFYIALLIGWVACPIKIYKTRQTISSFEEIERARSFEPENQLNTQSTESY